MSTEVDRRREFDDLSSLIGALLGTREAPLASPLARATRAGQAWDQARLTLFDRLFAALHSHVPVDRPAGERQHNSTFAFYEAYFSNFIEGTEFTIEEAREIVFDGSIPPDRPQDAHDILGTFDLVGDPALRVRTPADADDLLLLLQAFHARIMAGRPEQAPGRFKVRSNRAGGTEFVAPSRVAGTLRRGFDYREALQPGFARAAFAMFLVSEVHPFADGNGRVARAFANAELSACSQQRLMIPIVYRDDYLQALRAMSHRAEPTALIRVLDRAQAWAGELDWSSLLAAEIALKRTNALLTPSEAEERGLMLRLPSELPV